ncbi:MAG TPA: response regulator transcription factor [Oculatellaceae cyanobacterium]
MSELSIQPPEKRTPTVAIFNSSAIVCKGMEFVVQSIENLQLIGTATSTAKALALVRRENPDLVITDVTSPALDGILITQTIKDQLPSIKVLILTSVADDEHIFEALWAGADGYCLNDASAEKVKNAVQSVLGGAMWLDSSIVPSIRKGASDLGDSGLAKQPINLRIDEDLAGLTGREIEVLGLVALGYSNSRIATELSISFETVKTHIRHIMRKLAVTDRTQAAVLALKRRIVQ